MKPEEGNTGVENEPEDLLVEVSVTLNNLCRHYDQKDEHAMKFTMQKAYELSHKAFGHLRALDRLEEENAELRQSLSELREEYQLFKKGIARGSELYAHLRFDDEPFTPYQLCLQSLKELIPIAEWFAEEYPLDFETYFKDKSAIERAKLLKNGK